MKYNICINQKALSAFKGLDLKDAAILDYLYIICNSRNPKILSFRDSNGYNWVNYNRLIKDNPLLGIQSRNAITPRIHKLEKAGFIKTKLSYKNGVKRLSVKLTSKIDCLYFDFSDDRVRETYNPVRETYNHHTDNQHNTDRVRETDNPVRETDRRVRETDSETVKIDEKYFNNDDYVVENQNIKDRVRETDNPVRETDNRVRENSKPVRETVHNNTTTDNNISIKEKYKKEKKSVARFTAPIEIDVYDYFLKKIKNKKNAKNQADLFYAFYASKNWMVGKNKMKNWKAAASGWIVREKIKTDEQPKPHNGTDRTEFPDREFGIIL